MKLKVIFGLVLVSLLIPVFVYLEFDYFSTNVSEIGLVESFQELILLFLFVSLRMSKLESLPKISDLLSWLFLIFFIRELDFAFDRIVHGFWFWIALPILGYMVFNLYRYRKEIRAEVYSFFQLHTSAFLVLGFTVLLVFSRLFGTSKLWKVVLDDDYNRVVKTVIQEGMELFGYSLILFAILLLRNELKTISKSA